MKMGDSLDHQRLTTGISVILNEQWEEAQVGKHHTWVIYSEVRSCETLGHCKANKTLGFSLALHLVC